MNHISKTLLLALVLSYQSFAFDLSRGTGQYTGGGTWKSEDGTSNKWTAELSLTKGSTGAVVVKEKLVITTNEGKEFIQESELINVPTKNGFFNVLTKGVKTGSGYCFNSVCHVGSTEASGAQHEETFAVKDGQIFRMGSAKHTTYNVAWTGVMKKK